MPNVTTTGPQLPRCPLLETLHYNSWSRLPLRRVNRDLACNTADDWRILHADVLRGSRAHWLHATMVMYYSPSGALGEREFILSDQSFAGIRLATVYLLARRDPSTRSC